MKAATGTVWVMLAGALAVTCCAGPALMASFGAAAATAWLSYYGYVLVSAVVMAAGAVAFSAYRHRVAVQGCSRPAVDTKAASHE